MWWPLTSPSRPSSVFASGDARRSGTLEDGVGPSESADEAAAPGGLYAPETLRPLSSAASSAPYRLLMRLELFLHAAIRCDPGEAGLASSSPASFVIEADANRCLAGLTGEFIEDRDSGLPASEASTPPPPLLPAPPAPVVFAGKPAAPATAAATAIAAAVAAEAVSSTPASLLLPPPPSTPGIARSGTADGQGWMPRHCVVPPTDGWAAARRDSSAGQPPAINQRSTRAAHGPGRWSWKLGGAAWS